LEAQIASLKKARKEENELRNGCTDDCKVKKKDMEMDLERLRNESREKDEKYMTLKEEFSSCQMFQEKQMDMKMITQLNQQNVELKHILSEENKVKLDLFSELGRLTRDRDLSDRMVHSQRQELDQLKATIAVLQAQVPHKSCHVDCSVPDSRCDGFPTPQQLDPNAAIYIPNQAPFGF